MREGVRGREKKGGEKSKRNRFMERVKERRGMRRSKTYHNGISPPSLGRKMKFFPKVLSVEEVMMDGGKCLPE